MSDNSRHHLTERHRPPLTKLLLGTILGILAALGQAPWGYWPISVLAYGLILWQVAAAPSRRAAGWMGFAAGFGHFALAMSWITEPFLVEAEIYGWMAPFALILMAIGGALFWTVPAWISGNCRTNLQRRAVLFAAAFVLSDWLRGWIFTGLPWALAGHIWIDTPVAQLAAIFGSVGLSAVTMIVAACPLAFRTGARAPWRAMLPGLAISGLTLASAFSFGLARLAQPAPQDTTHQIRLIQPNAAQAQKWDPYWSEVFFQRLIDLSAARDLDRPAPDAVIWPETAVNFLLEQSQDAPQQIAQIAGAPVILGIQSNRDARYFNSLTEFTSDGIGAVYDKFHLVPFGEYTPWGDTLAQFGITAFAARYGSGYSPGAGAKVMQFSGLPPVQPLICYEAVFSRHLITSGDQRPEWLLQVTNDGWFGTMSGPWQHLAQARLRAIEAGLPMMRAANTGISAVIDARGQIRASLGLSLEGRIDAALPAALPPTPWSRWRDWPVVFLALAAAFLAARKAHGRQSPLAR